MPGRPSPRRAWNFGKLMAGASWRALAVALVPANVVAGLTVTPAMAEDSSRFVSIGTSWTAASKADSGANITVSGNSYSNLGIINARGVGVWSAGGHANNGHDGGTGGNVSLVQNGALTGMRADTAPITDWTITDANVNHRSISDTNQRFSSVNTLPMIFVLSQGGAGGDDSAWRGPGGSGQSASLTLNAAVVTTGASYAGAWVSSVGMLGGWGGSDSGRADYLNQNLPSGGNVAGTLNSGSSISTNGAGAAGLVVESVGASGGGNWNGADQKWPSRGGNSGTATGINAGQIVTVGDGSSGMIVQSIGGQGSQQQADTSSAHNGGAGGSAGAVVGSNYGLIQTSGADSLGVALYSVGGLGASGSQKSHYGSGSYAGDNGVASSVTFTNSASGSILTTGDRSYAVLAQSVGGGIAAGYYNPLASETSGKGGDSGVWGHGGDGSSGGGGGMVSVQNLGSLETRGNDAAALVAQSLGGLGGDGGDATSGGIFIAVGLGGQGGMGGTAGLVDVRTAGGSITTSGDSSAAMMVQSIGGGNGGVARSYSAGFIGSVSVAIGGAGGDGGVGGAVNVLNSSTISTAGENASGIYAQSIGGGGGHGGSASAVSAAFGGGEFPSAAFAVSVGGSGGSGAHANTVDVTNYAGITTLGTSSHGITGQSIGGGGGDGGGATGYVLSAATYSFGSSVSVGASGGDAGTASAVSLTHQRGAILTSGSGAHGIFGLSVGGGGGSAGSASAAADIFKTGKFGGAVNLALGGTGGGGGDGAAVTVGIDDGASVTTRGNFANGIFAQSVGGGGGNGGNADSSAGTGLLFGDTVSKLLADSKVGGIIALQSTVGGSGGSGGHGAAVNVSSAGASSILTWGPNSHGIYAQSIGGGGGNAGGYSDGGDGRANVQVNIGGAGGGGGTGGTVTVSNTANSSITTYSDSSHAIYAQSVGGGGGAGGSMTSDKDSDADAASSFVAQVRKIDGADKFQEWVDKNGYTSDYQIVTGLAGLVNDTGIADQFEKDFREKLISSLYNSKLVQNHNWFSDLFKKAGLIDDDGNVIESASEEKSMSLTVGVGGSGGQGGNGNTVTVNNTGALTTSGMGAHGVFAQSVGGGGGAGGLAGSSNADGNTINLNVMVGGSAGGGGSGGAVTLSNSGAVSTQRDASYGLFAQSIGGGGGNGGGSISPVTKNLTANFQVGGSGGSGGAGGAVAITSNAQVQTLGAEAHAILAQSVGGGGGAVTMNMGHDWDPSDDEDKRIDLKIDVLDKVGAVMGAGGAKRFKSESYDERKKVAGEKLLELADFTVRIGGTGGAGGAGGAVSVNHYGSIVTRGEAGIGILAQSIGGGGGLFSKTGKFDLNHGWDVKFNGHDGNGNHGGAVTVQLGLTAGITTHAYGSHAVLAQSIGGGGGYLGRTTNSVGMIADDNANGDGGAISIYSQGSLASITTYGWGANGIYAQSIGGGGGAWANVDDFYNADPTSSPAQARKSASGTGGAINISYFGSISTSGLHANAILAQSGRQMTNGAIDPNSPGGPITIHVEGGTIMGGTGKGAGIRIDGGSKDASNPNTVFIGDSASVGAGSGIAVIAHSGGVDHISVGGRLAGDVILTDNASNTAEQNNLHVEQRGYYQSRAGAGVVTLGVQGPGNWLDIWNGGTLDVGGVNAISSLAVTGGLNVAGGRVMVDVDVTPDTGVRSNDTISTSGDLYLYSSQALYGSQIQVNVVNGLLPGQFDIFDKTPLNIAQLTASNGGTGGPITWSVVNGGRSVSADAQFVQAASSFTLSPTESGMLGSLQQAWNAGNSVHAQLFGALANVQSAAAYQNAVTTLSTDGYQASAGAQTQGASTSMSAAMSCPVFSGTGMTINETQCVWGRISGARAQSDGVRPGQGSKQEEFSYRIGGQWEVAPRWFFGITGAYLATETSSKSGHIKSDGKGGDVSMALKHQAGNWLFAASAHLGYGSYDTTHRISVGSRVWSVNANQDVWTAGMRLRAAYQMDLNGFYIRPYLDLDAVHTYAPGFRSSGSFMHDYHFGEMRKWTLAVSPVVEVGTRYDINDSTWLRPYLSVGASFMDNPELATKVRLETNGASFASKHLMDNRYLDIGAGLQLSRDDKLELRAEYKARIGETFTRHEAVGRMSLRF
jgi:hypothetical protein